MQFKKKRYWLRAGSWSSALLMCYITSLIKSNQSIVWGKDHISSCFFNENHPLFCSQIFVMLHNIETHRVQSRDKRCLTPLTSMCLSLFSTAIPWCFPAGCWARRTDRASRSCAVSWKRSWKIFRAKTRMRYCMSIWRRPLESWGPWGAVTP